MGMGSYGAYAETVEETFVNSVCPIEFGMFFASLKEAGTDFDSFCQAVDEDYDEALEASAEQIENIYNLYEKLQTAFLLNTGLALEVVYHIAEDRGDMLDGGSFSLDGVYEMTPAAKKIKIHIRRKWWTSFG